MVACFWLLHTLRLPMIDALMFMTLLLAAEHFKFKTLIFGLPYLLCTKRLKVEPRLPLNPVWMKTVQNGVAMPLIMALRIVQIDVQCALQSLGWMPIATLLPALAGLPSIPLNTAQPARRHHAEH
ncbi:hypothetical protein PMM47T1_09631 [Pseudomonas sp. M47T1]|nr:hypothetical protein PMM47T1_09631 [Pseudomonas sp. M47T1]